MGDRPVIAFLSTGRCGTQWLAAGLAELYPELDVEHEPIGPLYQPRRYFRRYHDPEALLAVPEVASHLERIVSAERPYVETGWPLFAALPLMARRLPGRLRVVHLTRHPVPTALLHLSHNTFAGSARDDVYTRLATLAPTDPGVFQPHYATYWDRFSPYERCLYWWTEVHLFGIEFPGRCAEVPFIRIQAEEMLSGDPEPLTQMLEFMGLPWKAAFTERSEHVVDRWHHHTDRDVDPLEVHRHPVTVDVARRLGYDIAELNLGALEARYRGEPDPGLDRIGRYA